MERTDADGTTTPTVGLAGKAEVTVRGEHEVLVTRKFAAPRHLVFRAWTEPELIGRWWSAGRGEVTSIEVDLRPGGRWRYAMTATGGFEVAFHGEYREVVPDERLVTTEVYEGAPELEAVTTAVFTESAGRTTVSLVIRHGSTAARDAHLAAGMADGLQDALDLLEGVALSLR